MPLRRSVATLSTHLDDFAAFECWRGEPTTSWGREVEDHVRVHALRYSEHCLAFRDEASDELVAVSAFGRREGRIPLLGGAIQPCWHLDVVAVRADRQRTGLSGEVFDGTFAAMRDLNSDLAFVTARAHRDNESSICACGRVGLDFYYAADDTYLVLLKELD